MPSKVSENINIKTNILHLHIVKNNCFFREQLILKRISWKKYMKSGVKLPINQTIGGQKMGRVKINPKALKWARIDSGYDYDNLPNKIKPKFRQWESGKLMPTWNQLCDISRYFKRPTAFFFREKFPKHIDPELIEYRKSNNLNLNNITPTLKIGIREVISRRDTFLEIMEEMHHPLTSFSQYRVNSENISQLSSHIREILNVDLIEQKSWLYKNNRKDTAHYNFINKWKEILSSKLGVLIFEIPKVDLKEMRALCIYYDKHPIILLNGADSPNGRIFSLFHELTHLILGESAICDVDKNNSKEWLCNNVAAEFLVPKEDLLKNHIVKSKDSMEWSNQELADLSNEYGISKESMLLMLIHTHRAYQKSYEVMKEDWKFKLDKKSFGGGSPVLNQIKYHGTMYSRLMLNAYENGVISSVEFSQNINLRLKHVDELTEQLFR